MAEKIKIEIYRKKAPEDFTKELAETDSRMATGSGAALTAALAASLLERAAGLIAETVKDNERVDYILRNAEILRGYMVHLIDEDVKCRGPLRKAVKEGDPTVIEAAREPAVAICSEILNMMTKCLEFLQELAAFDAAEAKHFLASSAELALGAMKAVSHYIIFQGDLNSDETYRYIARREIEMTMEEYLPVYEDILSKTGC